MDLTIPAKNLRTFSNAIQCLAKTGQTLFISCHPGELTLRTINDGRSSFMCATFGRDFFEGRGPLVSAPKALSQRKRKGEGRKRKRKRRGESKRDRRGDISNSLESSTDEGERSVRERAAQRAYYYRYRSCWVSTSVYRYCKKANDNRFFVNFLTQRPG